MKTKWVALICAIFVAAGSVASADADERRDAPAYGMNLESFAYPFPVERFAFTSQKQAMTMAYFDLRPDKPNGRTAVLLHGKNFCAATWETTAIALRNAGYRVIGVDQIGFCKSSKPDGYQFSFHQLAYNTHEMLQSLGITKPIVIGHSTGGMLAARYALVYGGDIERLVLVDPIGLEDWKALGVPPLSVDQSTEREMKTTVATLAAYEKTNYYAGTWKPEYERWVDMYAGMFAGADLPRMARITAQIDEMIYTQPVVYEFPLIKVPTLLIIGGKDRTAPGRDMAPADVREALGNYPQLGKAAARAIPNAMLVEFPDYGHAPWVQDPDRVNAAIVDGIR